MFYPSLFFALSAALAGSAIGQKVEGKKLHSLSPEHMRQTRAAPRIINGTTADDGEYPFFVQAQGCGGSLIWKDIVLSAAHCELGFYGQVLVGGSIGLHEQDEYSEYIDLAGNYPHPNYDSSTTANDYMISVLAQEFTNPNVDYVPFADKSTNLQDGDRLTVIGHGLTDPWG